MEIEIIQNKIYEIRGQRVMLDRDLAELYNVETKVLKQAVKRNITRFEGEDFMFELTNREYNSLIFNLRSQIVTSNAGGNRYSILAFTELGVAMISSVLRSDIAIDINRSIMRAFVTMRGYLSMHNSKNEDVYQLKNDVSELKEYIEEVFKDYNDINEDTAMQLELINKALAELSSKKTIERESRNKIGFKR